MRLTTDQHQKIVELRKTGCTWDDISEAINNGMDGHAIRKRHGQWKNSYAYIPLSESGIPETGNRHDYATRAQEWIRQRDAELYEPQERKEAQSDDN